MVEHSALVKLVGALAVLRPLGDALALEFEEFRLNPAGNGRDDLVLQLEQVGQVPVVSLGDDVMVGVGADQRTRRPDLRTLPSSTYRTPSSCPTFLMSTVWPPRPACRGTP
jgi:hypothetical protein